MNIQEDDMSNYTSNELMDMAEQYMIYGKKMYPAVLDHGDGVYLYDKVSLSETRILSLCAIAAPFIKIVKASAPIKLRIFIICTLPKSRIMPLYQPRSLSLFAYKQSHPLSILR